MPLALHALPPRATTWQPIVNEEPQGDTSFGHAGAAFGDGSGEYQHEIETSVATWSVVRLRSSQPC